MTTKRAKPNLAAVTQPTEVSAIDVNTAPMHSSKTATEGHTAGVTPESIDTEDLKEMLKARGFEVRTRQRDGMPIMSQAEHVKGKVKIGIYLPKQMRIALEHARLETGTSIGHIIEAAVADWMAANGYRFS